MKFISGVGMAVLMLGACSKSPEGGTVAKNVADETPAPAGSPAQSSAIRVSVPQIAYTYSYGYRIPAGEIGHVQDRHIALCDRLGPGGCRVIAMERQADGDALANGSLKLAVRATSARAFGRALAAAAAGAGGEETGSSIAAEDLSRQIVDTEARLRARQVLAERLMELLRTRTGPVADLVAAERSVAAVQEEIDAARSWLEEARGRVAMSTLDLTYMSGGGGFVSLRDSVRAMGTFFGESLGLLVRLVAVLLPWAVVAAGVLFAVRWLRRRRRIIDEN